MAPSRSPQAQTAAVPTWIWLALILFLAFALRFWHLGEMPPGLYRDEAFNGLDAQQVLNGHTPLYFPANNGREPLYIYLTSIFVALWGNTVWAVRGAAALVGSLTTMVVFGLARRWFGTTTALFAAFLWAATVWPIHLSRVGLRVVLLVPVLAGAAWLATAAWQASQTNAIRARWLWIAAGLVYTLSFYTYLAGRFTPVLVIALILMALWHGRWTQLKPALIWGGLGLVLGVLPLLLASLNQPEILLGRPGQVSILNPQINKGDFWGTLWQHSWRTLGLFFWRGDDIIRHNPPGRPLFDKLMVVPFVLGLAVIGRRWRQPALWLTLLWVAIMVWPTILAEDAPHFLRGVGILPAALFIPAVGLSEIATWPKLDRLWRVGIIAALLCGSLLLTVRDYFFVYNQMPDTGFLFEAAAKTLTDQINDSPAETVLLVDRRYRDGWPSVPFLLEPQRRVQWIDPVNGDWPDLSLAEQSAELYLWPFDPAGLAMVPQVAQPPAAVQVEVGPLARGDLEPTPYPLYIRYVIGRSATPGQVSSAPPSAPMATFSLENEPWRLQLVTADVQRLSNQKLAINLFWSTDVDSPIDTPLTVFVHVLDPASGAILSQSDAPPAAGYWQPAWFVPGVSVQETRQIALVQPAVDGPPVIVVGVYPTDRPELRLSMTGQVENLFSSNAVQLSLEDWE